MKLAAQQDRALAKAGAATAQAQGTDFWTGMKQFWDGLGPAGQILSVGGLALGAIGLLNTFSGEGGLGSLLMAVLGGGGMLLGMNKGLRGSALGMLGLGGLAGGGQGETPMTEEQLAAARAQVGGGPPPPGANGEPTVAPTGAAPAAPAFDINDPAMQTQMMGWSPQRQTGELLAGLEQDPARAPGLADASAGWKSMFGAGRMVALPEMQKQIKDLDANEAQALIGAWDRLPQARRDVLVAQGKERLKQRQAAGG
jgi:hypothetical protein